MPRRRLFAVGRSEDPTSDRPEGGDAGGPEVGDGQRLARVAHGDVAAFETVEIRMEHLQVRRCLESLTSLQRESVDLAFYRGYTQREVSDLLEVPLGTVKSRVRDGLTRLRDCLGVA